MNCFLCFGYLWLVNTAGDNCKSVSEATQSSAYRGVLHVHSKPHDMCEGRLTGSYYYTT